jgi:oligopeptide transport system ATP-binding protein
MKEKMLKNKNSENSFSPVTNSRLLQVEDLSVVFNIASGTVKAVDGISYNVNAGETVAILGESGAGKSVSVRAILSLIQSPPGKITSGKMLYRGVDILQLKEEELRRIRGREIAMIPQDPLSALNPVFPIGWQIAEVFKVHERMKNKRANELTIRLLERVRIPDAARRVGDYPLQFSGGMRQRVLIAMALAFNPKLLIADEPTTALDVTTQAQILALLTELQSEYEMGLILITHNLGIVAEYAQRVAVMYAGRFVETGPTRSVLRFPAHPYTMGLKQSLPSINKQDRRLSAIPGAPPDLLHVPTGCAFHPRCQYAQKELCMEVPPSLKPMDDRHVACYFKKDVLNVSTNRFG